jgi:hypothetical protein
MEIEWKINEDTTEPVESPLFRVSIDSKQSDSYNTTGNKLLIGQLQSQLRYSVRVSSLVASRINNRTVVEGLASRPEFLFIPKR